MFAKTEYLLRDAVIDDHAQKRPRHDQRVYILREQAFLYKRPYLGLRMLEELSASRFQEPLRKPVPLERAEYQKAQEGIVAGIPLGRAGTVDDVAGVALFLASELSSFVTGQVVDINGGANFR